MQATPTTWRLLIGAGWMGGSFTALCGGEPMPADLAADLLRRSTSLWNLYGPTETTIWSTCHQVREVDDLILVGRPIANTTTYIVDKYDQPTPVGVAGELLIGGLGVTKGYYGRPNLTEKSFIPDSFSGIPGQKIYRTGDMAQYLSDGTIKLHGRIDQQVKLRGYRIELGEIEAVLLSCEEIEQAAVIVKEFAEGDQRLVAYFTGKEGFADPDKLRKVLRGKLPQYMLPSFFEQLEKMPLTANGKIDRGRLPFPVLSDSTRVGDYVQAATKVEEVIGAIWSEVLQVERVGVEDNFFDLGGNSLLVVQVLAKVEKELQFKVPTIKFFQYPTISTFARYLTQQNESTLDTSIEKKASLQKQALLRQKRMSKRRNG
jgi:acyl carrier protein